MRGSAGIPSWRKVATQTSLPSNRSKLYSYFNDIRVRSFILIGAPNYHHSEQNDEPGGLDRQVVIGPFLRSFSKTLMQNAISAFLHGAPVRRRGIRHASPC